jgi:hypothetical protein
MRACRATKLKHYEAAEIKWLLLNTRKPKPARIGKLYGVHAAAIHEIRGRTWVDVQPKFETFKLGAALHRPPYRRSIVSGG